MIGSSSLRKRALGCRALPLALCALASSLSGAQPAVLESAEPAQPRFSWSGLHRVRYARLWNQYRPGLRGDDQVLELRTVLGATYDLGRASLVAELHDARAYLTDEQSGISTTVVNTLEIGQAYVEIGDPDGDRGASIKAGRFLFELGSGRLFAAEQYRNVARGYLGLAAETAAPKRGRLVAFATLPTQTLPADRQALLDNERRRDEEDFDLATFGVFWELPRFRSGTSMELYVFGLDEDDDPAERETPDRRLTTSGLRIWRDAALGAWDFEAELIRQTGLRRASANPSDERGLDVDASFAHLEAGYTFRARWSPRISLEYEQGSGDSDPTDDRWERFDPLYGNRRTDLAPTGIYALLGRENIDTLGVRVSITPSEVADAFIAFRSVRLAEAVDFFASTGVRDPSGASGRDGGMQLDARYRRWLRRDALRVDVGATFLSAGRFLRTAPNATREGDPTYFYGELTYTFGSK